MGKSKTLIAVILSLLCSSIFFGSCSPDLSVDIPSEYKTCVIDYELNGGTNNDQNKSTIEQGESVFLTEPSKYGYKFLGWYTEDGDIVTEVTYNEVGIKLYAMWELESVCYDNLPLVKINTIDSKIPENKQDYIECDFSLSNTNSYFNNTDGKYDLQLEMGTVGIRLRGNSTQGMNKKPFRIKFDKKQSLFGYEKNKSWVLLADYIDQSNIRNYAAFKIANSVGGVFSPHGTHVVLIINGIYQGMYLLTEQIDENKGRTAIKSNFNPIVDTDFPFLVEMDRNALLEGEIDVDTFEMENLWYPIEIKYPEFEERNVAKGNDVVFSYIKEYMWAVFYTLKTDEKVSVSFREAPVGFEDLVDEDSFLNYILINEIMGNRDNAWGSIYMSKSKNGKLKFGPVWDFDWSICGGWTGSPYQEICVDYANEFALIKKYNFHWFYFVNETRYNKMVNKFYEIKPKVLKVVNDLIEYYGVIYNASIIDAKHWYGEKGDYMFSSQFCAVRLFLIDKINYIESVFSKTFSEAYEMVMNY